MGDCDRNDDMCIGDALPNEPNVDIVGDCAELKGCEGDQETKDEEQQLVRPSGKEGLPVEIVELFKENNLSRTPSNTSCFSIMSDVKSSKIPRIADSNLSLHSRSNIATANSKSITSISTISSLSSNDKIFFLKTNRIDRRKGASPGITVRGLELELKALKKKFLETKSDFDVKEKALEKISNHILAAIEKISGISGKEKHVDDDLLGIKRFVSMKMGEQKELSGPDLSLFINYNKENSKIWNNLIEEILRYRTSMIKWLEGKKLLDSKPEFYSETETINKKIECLKKNCEERQRAFMVKVEGVFREPSQQIAAYKCKIKGYESTMKEQENYMATLKKSVEDKTAEYEKLLLKQKEVIEKYKIEVLNKNKEIESLKDDNARLQNLNKNMTKTTSSREREYKECIATLNKQHDESSKREKQFEKKYDEVREKLGNVQMRENNLKKKLCVDCQPDGCEVIRDKLIKQLDQLNNQLKGAHEKVQILENEKRDISRLSTSADELQASTKSLLSEEERNAYKRITKRLRAKVQLSLSAKKQAEEVGKEKMRDLMVWEEELQMRENRLYHQMHLKGAKDLIMDILKKQNLNRDRRSPQ